MAFQLRPFTVSDVKRIAEINLDPWVENFHDSFYHLYLIHYPQYCFVVEEAFSRCIVAYLLGKVEGQEKDWHSHVTAIAVHNRYRRQGIAGLLMDEFEQVSKEQNAYFADLFVRASNKLAITMYAKRGYEVYRTVKNYYNGDEDAYDMRKPLERDTERWSLLQPHATLVDPNDVS